MKPLLTVVALTIIAVVANASKPFHPQSSTTKRGVDAPTDIEIMKSFKGRLRGFELQTDYFAPVSNAEVCQTPEYLANISNVYRQCTFISPSPLEDPTAVALAQSSTTQIRSAWESFCTGVCLEVLGTFVDIYSACIHPAMKMHFLGPAYLCRNRDSAGDRCGVTLSKYNVANKCGARFLNYCRAAGEFCAWTSMRFPGGSTLGICYANYTQEVLSDICGPCAKGFAKLNNQIPQYGDIGFSDDLDGLCLRAPSGSYCAPLLLPMALTSNTFDINYAYIFSQADKLAAICNDTELSYCVRATVGRNAAKQLANAREQLVLCAARYSNVTSDVNSYCLPSFKLALRNSRETARNIGMMCVKNAAGQYCLPQSQSLLSSSCILAALGPLGTCSLECAQNVTATVGTLGCCVGNIQQLVIDNNVVVQLSSEDLPFILGYTGETSTLAPIPTMAPAPGTTAPVVLGSGEELIPNPVDGGLYDLGVCNVDGLNQTLRKRCAVPAAAKVSGSILVPIVYSEINANPERKKRVKGSLRVDVATTARVPVQFIIDDDIVESSLVKVPTANSTSSLRRQSGSPTANGCLYKYTIQTVSSDVAQAAYNINNATLLGRVPLNTTQATLLTECASTCGGTAGVLGISEVQTGPAVLPQTETSSSCTGAVIWLALVAAALQSLELQLFM